MFYGVWNNCGGLTKEACKNHERIKRTHRTGHRDLAISNKEARTVVSMTPTGDHEDHPERKARADDHEGRLERRAMAIEEVPVGLGHRVGHDLRVRMSAAARRARLAMTRSEQASELGIAVAIRAVLVAVSAPDDAPMTLSTRASSTDTRHRTKRI